MSIDPLRITAYPWNPRGGNLCPLLNDPDLWATALAEHQRRAVKTAAKKLGRREVISITNDQKIGELCCWLLQKFHSRKKLAQILERDGYSFVHQALWSEFYLDDEDIKTLLPLDTFTINRADRLYLDTEAFSMRIREVTPKNCVLRSITILGAAFAMLQPDDAITILQILLDFEPSLEEQLLNPFEEANSTPEPPALPDAETDASKSESDLIAGAQGLVSDASKIERPLTLTRAWIQGGQRTAEACLSAYSTLMRHVAALQEISTNLDLSQDSPMETEASQLANAAKGMHDAAAGVDSWLDEWLNPLQTSLSSAPDSLREPLGHLFEAFRAPRSTAAQVQKVSENLIQAFSDLSEIHTKGITQNQGLRQNVLELQTDLGRAEAVSDYSAHAEDLIKMEHLNARLQEEKVRLSAERASLVISRQTACQANLDYIDPTSRTKDETYLASFESLRTEIYGTCTLENIASIEARIQTLSEHWPRLVPIRTVEELAADALDSNANPARILELAEGLINAGRHVETALLLELFQEVYEPEAIEVELPKFFETLLLSWSCLAPSLSQSLLLLAAKAADGGAKSIERQLPKSWLSLAHGFGDRWVIFALSGKWIAGITSGDVPDPKMRCRLAGAFLAIHAAGASEPLMGVLYNLGLNGFEFDEAAPNLRRLLSDVIAQRRFVISDGILEKKIADAKRGLAEFFQQQDYGDFVHQIAHGNDVAEAERKDLFPALRGLVDSLVQDVEHGVWNGSEEFSTQIKDIAREAFRKHGLTTTSSSFYQKKIFGSDGYLETLDTRVQRFLSAQREYAERFDGSNNLANLAALNQELTAIAAEDTSFLALWESVQKTLNSSLSVDDPAISQSVSGVGLLLDIFPDAMIAAPRLVLRFASQKEAVNLTSDDLRDLLEAISHSDIQANVAQLENAGCLPHALVASVLGGINSSRSTAEKLDVAYTNELARLEQKCHDFIVRCPSNTNLLLAIEAISLGKWPLAKTILQNVEENLDRTIADAQAEAKTILQDYRTRVAECQQGLEDHGADLSADRLIELCGAASARISSVIRQSQRDAPPIHAMTNAQQLVDAIEFASRNRSSTFSEIECLLGTSTPRSIGSLTMQPLEHPNDWGDSILQISWEFLAKQRKLHKDLRPECNRRWSEFVRAFCRLSEMYHDPNESLTYSLVPGCHFGYYKSEFYSPRSAWLDRPVHFYLLLKTDDWEDQWSRLDAVLRENADALSIVIVPEGLAQLRDRFRIGKLEDPFVLVGEVEARQISSAKVPGAPLRQMLHRGASRLTDIGLFCTDGAVHIRKNLFVGRESALDRLEVVKASAVWGGRRIGKTSLLHALKERLTNKRPPYKVGYIYADPLHGDPDLTLATRITESLALQAPDNVGDLAALLNSACKHQRVAVLIDEVDRYIEASRAAHGDSQFPLARVLRGVSSQNPDTFKVVYAGFKQLYYEVNIRPNPDNAYPFKNFTTPLGKGFGDLDADMVEQLLQMAFEDMLGIALEPGVARLVKDKTSGHPAFVQEFGRQLLEIVERRRRASKDFRITKQDVEAVYEERPDGTGGHSSYIDYVYETLNWNLSSLGKAIMLAICNDIVAAEHPPDHQYRRSQISTVMERWSTKGAQLPRDDDFANSLKFLEMTNMLVRHLDRNSDSYSVAYPSYIDFMVKLGDRNRIRVNESLMGYHENEMGKIV